MYKLVYIIGGIKATIKNKDVAYLRHVIFCLSKEDKWFLYNVGGIMIDSSEEVQ